MKAEFFIVVSILLTPSAQAFDLDSIDGLPILKKEICHPYICFEAEKEQQKYLIVIDANNDEPIFVFSINGRELTLIYARDTI